jgi:hypothetical protein
MPWQLEITIGENVIEKLILHTNYRGAVFVLTHLTEAFEQVGETRGSQEPV